MQTTKKALVTGMTGQDGAYPAPQLHRLCVLT